VGKISAGSAALAVIEARREPVVMDALATGGRRKSPGSRRW